MEAGRKCTKVVDATEAAKGPDAKIVLGHRISQRIKDAESSSDSGEEELREFLSDEAILKQAKERCMLKDARVRQQAWDLAQKVEEIKHRRKEAEEKRNAELALRRTEAEKRLKAEDPLSDIPSFLQAENTHQAKPRTPAPAASSKEASPLERNTRTRHKEYHRRSPRCNPDDENRTNPALKVAILKIALDCDPSFVGRHNCVGAEKPLELTAVSRSGVGWAVHCVVHRERDAERAIDAVLESDGKELVCREVRMCTNRHR